jgi:hypothetical protein
VNPVVDSGRGWLFVFIRVLREASFDAALGRIRLSDVYIYLSGCQRMRSGEWKATGVIAMPRKLNGHVERELARSLAQCNYTLSE